jgi:hypothetical protein
MITNPEIIQAVLDAANRYPDYAEMIVSPLLRFGEVTEIGGKWTFQEKYANISIITAGVVATNYYAPGNLENLEPDLQETEYYRPVAEPERVPEGGYATNE